MFFKKLKIFSNYIGFNNINGGSFSLTVAKKNSKRFQGSKLVKWALRNEDLFGYNNFMLSAQYSYMSKQFTDSSNAISGNLSGVIGQIPDYKILSKQTEIIGTWDDHDCGINDADKFFKLKNERMHLHLDYLIENLINFRNLY